MARTVEDVLARRTRALFLDARAAIEAAPVVATFLPQNFREARNGRQGISRVLLSLQRVISIKKARRYEHSISRCQVPSCLIHEIIYKAVIHFVLSVINKSRQQQAL